MPCRSTSPTRSTRSTAEDEINGAWRELAAADAELERGEIDEDGWYRRLHALCIPAYLAAENPRAQSGQSGDEAGWEHARSLVVEAIDGDGAFLDIGCASGHLMETARVWTAARGFALEPYGMDIAPEMVELARARLPQWADRIWLGNALDWEPPRRFDFVHLMELDYVPKPRRRELFEHLLREVCEPGGRLILGPTNERVEQPALGELVASWGYEPAGRAERPKNERAMRRCLWIDV